MAIIYTASQNEGTVLGMMSKNNVILAPQSDLFWTIRKSKNKIMFLPKVALTQSNCNLFLDFFKGVLIKDLYQDYSKISFGYFNQEMLDVFSKIYFAHSGKKFPRSKTMKLTAVQSVFENAGDLFGEESLAGKQFIELRETRNKFQSKIKSGMITLHQNPSREIYNTVIKPLIEPFLKSWDESEGKKYGWQRHSGYDKNFFTEERYEKHADELQTTFIVDTILNQLIGYSVISLQPIVGSKSFPYVIRKCNTHYSRNITKFMDYISIKGLYEKTLEPSFSVHWGASSGGVLKYKLSAFPKTDTEHSYFLTLPSS